MLHRRSARAWAATTALIALVATGCGPTNEPAAQPESLAVVTTTGILADLVRHVGGERVRVSAVIPEGADPHSYEPSLRDVRDVVYADAAFTNYLMLEEQSVIKMIDANLPAGRPNVSLAEHAVEHAAQVIPLVEDVSLDAVWLGARVAGGGEALGATRSTGVELRATGFSGPGPMHAYLTGAFGDITRYFDLAPGSAPTPSDRISLPPGAHTHLTWAFSEPGIYELSLEASIGGTTLPESVATFAVGVDPARAQGLTPVTRGHADVTADLDLGALTLAADIDPRGGAGAARLPLGETVIAVPNTTLQPVPGEPAFRFLGRPGAQVFQLPQAVLGKHVHGEIDPHLWHDARNAIAYVRTIEETLARLDPDGSSQYAAQADGYVAELEAVDSYVRDTIAEIPARNRQLVTTHDAFGYLANAYDLRVAGFVTPNPATEPSIAERRRLTLTLQNLEVPAVFLEPNLASRSSTLVEVAAEQGIAVCPILGDALTEDVRSYVDMMRFNADSLRRCLS